MKHLRSLLLSATFTLVGCSHVHVSSDFAGITQGVLRLHQVTGTLPYCPEGATGASSARPYNRWNYGPASKASVTCNRALGYRGYYW